ncbi:MAG TPA: PDZ domain-containing protein [Phycisphaerae bacterium]|nr:PDZ domain-containing protein [Phycisphaerae bacterium]
MEIRRMGWVVAALATALIVGSAAADEPGAPQGQMRIEVRVQKPGEEAAVRTWVNGKEVDPGGVVQIAERDNPGRRDDDRAVLGVMIQPLTDEAADRAKVDHGAVVAGTTPGSAAEKAGLREGDVIISADGKPVDGPEQLVEFIGNRRPGDNVRLAWSRGGERMKGVVILGGQGGDRKPEPPDADRDRPKPPRDEPRPDEPRPDKDQPRARAFLGVSAAPLTDDIREISGARTGTLINSLPDGSPADKAGLKPGDVITRIDDREIGGPGDLIDAMRDRKPGERVRVEYFRMGKQRETKVTLGEWPDGEPEKKGPGPLLDLPGELFGDMPQLRDYLKKLQPNMEEWAKRLQPVPGKPGVGPRDRAPAAEAYDVGKDLGRILERLERIERRLDELEGRIERRDR